MIVFGDPQQQMSIATLVARLEDRVAAVARGLIDTKSLRTPYGLDRLRRLLIDAGAFEQAVDDYAEHAASSGGPGLPPEVGELVHAVTDGAATLFCAGWDQAQHGYFRISIADELAHVAAGVQQLRTIADEVDLTVKTPEGFAFYTLYPEQYCAAALEWSAVHVAATDRAVAVVGVRSIGTTLSAVVLAALGSAGWPAHRFTVRPSGPPWSRDVSLASTDLGDAQWALVVDEGPGLSGSSMAATAESLVSAGMAPDRVSFLPGHGGEPGAMTSEPVRHRWATTRRHVTALDELRWNGRSLPQLLADVTPEVTRSHSPVDRVDDLSAGIWRQFAYDRPDDWPAVDAPFERTKYLCHLRDRTAVLWKFAGQDDEATFLQLRERARHGRSPSPLGVAHGFVAMPWQPERPLDVTRVNRRVLGDVAGYVSQIAGPPLSRHDRSDAVVRLAEMLYWNTREGLGEASAERTRRWSERAGKEARQSPSATYADGRMAPHEWRVDNRGNVKKLPGVGHDHDHTMIGPQSVAWDVAGTIVEWELTGRERAAFLRIVERSHRFAVSLASLRFHEMAYAAFRLGQTVLSAGMSGGDAAEQRRSDGAVARYRSWLAGLLDQDPQPGRSSSAPTLFTQST